MHLGEESDIKGLKALNSDTPIDPDAPELGSIRNSFVFIAGRDQTGRQEFTTRFVKDALGSVNRIGHTDICGLGFRMGNLAFTEGKEVEIKADAMSAEYILVFGANIYEALQPGINSYGAMIAKRYSEGKVKFTIVDPRATLGQYAKFAGVERSQIEKTAMEFTSHGTRAAVTQYHGAGNYVSGTYAAYAVAMLPLYRDIEEP